MSTEETTVWLRPDNSYSLSATVYKDGSVRVMIHCPAGYFAFRAHPTAAEKFISDLVEAYGATDRGGAQ